MASLSSVIHKLQFKWSKTIKTPHAYRKKQRHCILRENEQTIIINVRKFWPRCPWVLPWVLCSEPENQPPGQSFVVRWWDTRGQYSSQRTYSFVVFRMKKREREIGEGEKTNIKHIFTWPLNEEPPQRRWKQSTARLQRSVGEIQTPHQSWITFLCFDCFLSYRFFFAHPATAVGCRSKAVWKKRDDTKWWQ